MRVQRRSGLGPWLLGALALLRVAAAQSGAGLAAETAGAAGAAAAPGAAEAAPGAVAEGPRPLTAAEREGVQLAARYLAGGPAAWWPLLARGSWLRGLGREAALAEIEVRAGAPAGSRWTLQAAPAWFAEHGAVFSIEFPSGEDDTLQLRLVPEDGGWKIDSLRVAAESGSRAAAGAAATAPSVGGSSPEAASGGSGAGSSSPGVAGISGVAGQWLRLLLRPAVRGPGALVLAGVLALAAALLVVLRRRAAARRRRAAQVTAAPPRASFVAVAPPRQTPWATLLASAGAALLAVAALLAAWQVRHDGNGERTAGPAADGAGGGAGGTVAERAAEDTAAAAGGGLVPGQGPPGVPLRTLLPLRRAFTQAAPAPPGPPQPPGGNPPSATAAAPPPESPAMAGGAGPAGGTAVAGGAAAAGGTAATEDAPAAGSAAAAAVARLWRAQLRIAAGDLAAAEELLRGVPPRSSPLAELLAARLAFLRLQPVAAAVQYERAVAAGLAHEGMLLEAAQALYILGYEDTARRYLADLAALGARGAEIYYELASLALLDNREALAHQRFRTAWRLEPEARAELLEQPLSAFMLQDRELRRLLSLAAFAEPAGSCERLSRRALELPPGVTARLLGETLRLTGGGGEVQAAGACDLATAGAVQDGAAAWQEEREGAALARLPELQRSAASASSLAQPVVRHQTEEAAAALARRQRWTELIAISDGLAQPGAVLPPVLVRLRATALARTGRRAEARQLLVRLALGDKVSRRADPAVLYQLAGLLEQSGDYDQAVRLVAKANAQLPSPPSDDRLRQLQMEKRLAASSESQRSAHFLVSYPAGRGPAFGQEAVRILEAEHRRLERWIPAAGGEPIEVRLLPWEDFALAYSAGGEFLGLYDGVVRVPLGSLRTFSPPAVAVLSHELAHAMIARRTGDRAPHWLHEGLAQHIEMSEAGRVNPIAEYRAQDRLLTFPLLEPALASNSSVVWMAASYDEALWTVNYVESRYGVGGIHRLLDAFRAGQATDQALAAALGSSGARFDHDLWEWCLGGAPRAWRVEVVRYDGGPGQIKRF